MSFILQPRYVYAFVSNEFICWQITHPFHFPSTQDDNSLLKKQLKEFQNHLNHVVDGLIHPEEVAARVDELRKRLKLGAGEMR